MSKHLEESYYQMDPLKPKYKCIRAVVDFCHLPLGFGRIGLGEAKALGVWLVHKAHHGDEETEMNEIVALSFDEAGGWVIWHQWGLLYKPQPNID